MYPARNNISSHYLYRSELAGYVHSLHKVHAPAPRGRSLGKDSASMHLNSIKFFLCRCSNSIIVSKSMLSSNSPMVCTRIPEW